MRWRDPSINWRGGEVTLPSHTHSVLVSYIENGAEYYDDFFDCLLSNDLKGAVINADNINLLMIPHIVGWLYNYAPSACFGSRQSVKDWKLTGGLRGSGLL